MDNLVDLVGYITRTFDFDRVMNNGAGIVCSELKLN